VNRKVADAFLDYPDKNIKRIRVCANGDTEWTLFSEQNFERNATCLRSPYECYCTNTDDTTRRLIQSVGSFIRGCDLSQEYIINMKLRFRFKGNDYYQTS